MNKKYDIIYSIGRDCACATYMKKAKLRICSGPFDWLTNASFSQRFELLLNDFEGFLNIENLKPMEKPTQFPSDKNNDYYKNVKNGLYFWHDFPANEPFESSYPKVKEKYKRRIERFYKNIKTKEKVLLIWFSHLDKTPDDVVLDLCNKFCKKMKKQIDFLIIEHSEKQDTPLTYRLQENIERWVCYTQKFDENGAPTTLGNEKLVYPIFKKFKVILTPKEKIKKAFIHFPIKILCALIPIKSWRRKLKQIVNI